jgi:hypothetical protein
MEVLVYWTLPHAQPPFIMPSEPSIAILVVSILSKGSLTKYQEDAASAFTAVLNLPSNEDKISVPGNEKPVVIDQ